PCADFAYWAAQKERLKDSIKMIVNPYPVCKFTEDYFDFYRECKMKGVLCPKTYHNNNEVDSFPLIAKSRDKMEYKKLFNMRQVYNFTVGRNDLVLQKFIEGTVFEVDFLDEWLQVRLLPKSFPHITQIIDSDTVNKNYFSIVIKSLGIKFGTLRFVSDKNKDYIIDAWPMFKWEALFINPSIIDGLLKGSTPKSVKGKLVKVPHAIVMEV
ncbi:MAG: hypothetical protein KKD77_20775, partial [Gammaproteobacteria bacterium]|nr:hypothetical protein [Gammaproteobacteria bacterium]